VRVVNIVDTLIEEQESLDENSEEMIVHKFKVKRLSNCIRKIINDTGMISLSLSIDKKKVLACVYDKEATEDNFVWTHFDEERQLPYILTEEEYVEKIHA
jgi:hypothetical protein